MQSFIRHKTAEEIALSERKKNLRNFYLGLQIKLIAQQEDLSANKVGCNRCETNN